MEQRIRERDSVIHSPRLFLGRVGCLACNEWLTPVYIVSDAARCAELDGEASAVREAWLERCRRDDALDVERVKRARAEAERDDG
jgi:hypothetical protein